MVKKDISNRQIVAGIRLSFGLLVVAAIVIQISVVSADGVFNPVNFFSYFTILSNIFAATVFLIGGWRLLQQRQPSVADDVARGASILYMVITGIVYSILLAKYSVGLTLPWINAVLHYIMPVVVALDWLYQPQRSRLSFKQTLPWLIFPLAYVAYSLIRGSIVHWYPYPFLNPDEIGGYGGVALYCLGILLLFFALSQGLMRFGNSLRRNIK